MALRSRGGLVAKVAAGFKAGLFCDGALVARGGSELPGLGVAVAALGAIVEGVRDLVIGVGG
jgi:hypothetical protein